MSAKKKIELDLTPDADIRRFSLLETEKAARHYDLFQKQDDPIKIHEKRQDIQPQYCEQPEEKKKEKKKKKTPEDKDKKKKYVAPKTKKQVAEDEDRHKREKAKYFVCPRIVCRIPSPANIAGLKQEKKLQFSSAAQKTEEPQIIPDKISATDSMLKWPPPKTGDELALKIPKSQIYINRKKNKEEGKRKHRGPVDSFAFMYNADYRKQHKKHYEIFRASDSESEITVTEEEAEIEDEEIMYVDYGEYGEDKHDQESGEDKKIGEEEMGEELPEILSMHSAATSIDSEFKICEPVDSDFSGTVPILTKMVQKYKRDSETDLKQEAQPRPRKTLTTHSQAFISPIPKTFYYGTISGTLHQGDPMFSERSRNNQMLPNAVAAYVFSFLKPPSKWLPKDIDYILEMGDKLFLNSLEVKHIHEDRSIKPKDLVDIIEMQSHKIRFKIHDPDICGVTKSIDPKVFDLLKGMVLFFERFRAGILTVAETHILIMKRKRNYYIFDPTPRDMNLYTDDRGMAILANFYDVQAMLIMLIDRGTITNNPFIISRISVKKLDQNYEAQGDGDSIKSEFKKESTYNIVSPLKAVIVGGFHVGDKCFEDNKSRQALCVVIMGLIYYHITPSAAWHSKTIDKLLLIGNQFYLECIKEMTTKDFKIDNIPAFFTIGPLTIEILIYANQSAGLMIKKGQCFLEEMLRKFFQKHTTAIIEIDKYKIGIWKQRNFYYLFDPYSRNQDGLKTQEGGACISMNGTLHAMIETITHNFEQKDYIFRIHALKLCKLNRDPEYGLIPGVRFIDSELEMADSIKVGQKKAMQEKPISVDVSEQAVKNLDTASMSLGPSVVEIASEVASIDQGFINDLPQVTPEKPVFTPAPPPKDVLFDLDSPSLSDTQIDVKRPDPETMDSYAIKFLEELTKEELELEALMNLQEGYEGEEEGSSVQSVVPKVLSGGEVPRDSKKSNKSNMKSSRSALEVNFIAGEPQPEFGEEEEGEGRADKQIQKGKDPGLLTIPAEVNTDLLGISPLPRIELEPTDMKEVIRARRRARMTHLTQDRRTDIREPEVSQTEELHKQSNYTVLPDGSHILYGTRNITDAVVDMHEDASPYVSIIAVAMARKYSLHTWSTAVVDFILECGRELYLAIKVDFAAFYIIQVPAITIGRHIFSILAEHLFDSLLEPTILEAALAKLLFKKYGCGVVATKLYSCALFFKNGVYYMFDGYGCNLVGIGEGPDNGGVACTFRFKSLRALVDRFMYNKQQREIVEPTEVTRFIISTVKVSTVFPEQEPPKPRREKILEEHDKMFNEQGEEIPEEKPKPKNILGYTKKGKYFTIQGTQGCENRMDVIGTAKECHFISICALLGLLCKPIKDWSTKRVDYVFESGTNLFPYIDNVNFADKRSIRNLLIDKYFFDIVVKRIHIANPENQRNFVVALEFVLSKRLKYLLIQFPNCCLVLYKSLNSIHLFDPYGLHSGKEEKESKRPKKELEAEKGMACWVKFETTLQLKKYLQQNTQNLDESFFFFTVNIANFKKASKWRRLEYKLRAEKKRKKPKVKPLKLLHEAEDWLEVYPIPWTRMTKHLACGVLRDTPSHRWNHWDVEYPNDLFAMIGTLHQTSRGFSRIGRGKQTIANCIVAIVMTEMYSFPTWNVSILNSILRNGDLYFRQSVGEITDENYEIRIEDFKKELDVPPYNVRIDYKPLLEGTMYIIRPRQFNLSKALRAFFEEKENRHGIIACQREGSKTKFLAFGRVKFGEYYMYDCQTLGPPMFLDKYQSAAYILRCLSLNRLLHVMTMTLRGGDFFVYQIEIIPAGEEREEKEIETKVTDYGEDVPVSEVGSAWKDKGEDQIE